MDLAKNPTPGTRIYRAHSGTETESAGIHWTTNKDVVGSFPHRHHHEGFIDDPKGQVIPHAALSRIQFQGGEVKHPRDSRDMGFDWEAEVRLRPGTKVRMAGGGEMPIEHGGSALYQGLARQSVPGTTEARRHANTEAGLPHLQPALFDQVTNRETGQHLGWSPALTAHPGGLGEAIDASGAEHERLGEKHGIEPYFGTATAEMEKKMPAAPTMQAAADARARREYR